MEDGEDELAGLPVPLNFVIDGIPMDRRVYKAIMYSAFLPAVMLLPPKVTAASGQTRDVILRQTVQTFQELLSEREAKVRLLQQKLVIAQFKFAAAALIRARRIQNAEAEGANRTVSVQNLVASIVQLVKTMQSPDQRDFDFEDALERIHVCVRAIGGIENDEQWVRVKRPLAASLLSMYEALNQGAPIKLDVAISTDSDSTTNTEDEHATVLCENCRLMESQQQETQMFPFPLSSSISNRLVSGQNVDEMNLQRSVAQRVATGTSLDTPNIVADVTSSKNVTVFSSGSAVFSVQLQPHVQDFAQQTNSNANWQHANTQTATESSQAACQHEFNVFQVDASVATVQPTLLERSAQSDEPVMHTNAEKSIQCDPSQILAEWKDQYSFIHRSVQTTVFSFADQACQSDGHGPRAITDAAASNTDSRAVASHFSQTDPPKTLQLIEKSVQYEPMALRNVAEQTEIGNMNSETQTSVVTSRELAVQHQGWQTLVDASVNTVDKTLPVLAVNCTQTDYGIVSGLQVHQAVQCDSRPAVTVTNASTNTAELRPPIFLHRSVQVGGSEKDEQNDRNLIDQATQNVMLLTDVSTSTSDWLQRKLAECASQTVDYGYGKKTDQAVQFVSKPIAVDSATNTVLKQLPSLVDVASQACFDVDEKRGKSIDQSVQFQYRPTLTDTSTDPVVEQSEKVINSWTQVEKSHAVEQCVATELDFVELDGLFVELDVLRAKYEDALRKIALLEIRCNECQEVLNKSALSPVNLSAECLQDADEASASSSEGEIERQRRNRQQSADTSIQDIEKMRLIEELTKKNAALQQIISDSQTKVDHLLNELERLNEDDKHPVFINLFSDAEAENRFRGDLEQLQSRLQYLLENSRRSRSTLHKLQVENHEAMLANRELKKELALMDAERSAQRTEVSALKDTVIGLYGQLEHSHRLYSTMRRKAVGYKRRFTDAATKFESMKRNLSATLNAKPPEDVLDGCYFSEPECELQRNKRGGNRLTDFFHKVRFLAASPRQAEPALTQAIFKISVTTP